jgi:hypothetical protein
MNIRISHPLAAVLFSSLSFAQYGARAESISEFPELKQATEAYRRGDCQAAWDLTWPSAKAGKQEAIYYLWTTMVFGMVPPGRAKFSAASIAWHELTIAAHAAAVGPKSSAVFHVDPNHRWARKEIPILLGQLDLGDAGRRVSQCYLSDSSLEQCLNVAIATGVVQPFSDYAAAVDAEARETGIEASCRRP